MSRTCLAYFDNGGRCTTVQVVPTIDLDSYKAVPLRHVILEAEVPPSEVPDIESLNLQFETVIPENSYAVGETVTISPIPVGTTVRIDGEDVSEAVEEGALELSPDDAGTYVITLRKDGYDDLTLWLVVTE